MTDSHTTQTGPNTWRATLIDAGDGSGDLILTFPPELLEEMGWSEGTVLNLEKLPDGQIRMWEKK